MENYLPGLSSLPSPIQVIIGLFLLVLAVMWIMLPFAVASIQRKSNKILEVNEKLVRALEETNRLLSIQGNNLPKIESFEDSTDLRQVDESGRL